MSSVVIIRFSTNMKVLEVVSTEQLPRNMPHRYRAQSEDFHSRVLFITSWDTCPISDFLH